MSESLAGGPAAIAGFLYQMLCVSGMVARAHNWRGEHGGTLDGILELIKAEGITHERYQDGFVEQVDEQGAGEVTLVQIKSSVYGCTDTFPPSDIAEVVRSFDASITALRPRIVAHCSLLINQRLAKPWDEQRQGVSGALQRALESANEKLECAKRRDAAALERERERLLEMFGSIEVVEALEQKEWLEDLRRFGHSFGCDVEEVRTGISRLVFDMMQSVTGTAVSRWVGEQSLRYAFTGSHRANRLSRTDLADRVHRQVRGETLAAVQGLPESAEDAPDTRMFLRRGLFRRLDELVSTHPLVFVTGEGGVGKSVLVHLWLLERATGGWDDHGPLCHACRADRATQDDSRWMSRVAALEWTGVVGRQAELNTAAIERLEAACAAAETVRPLALIAVDGLDEQRGSAAAGLDRLLRDAWCIPTRDGTGAACPPVASFVVTCRGGEDRDLSRLLDLDRTGWPCHGLLPPTLTLTAFGTTGDEDELLSVLAEFAPDLAPRFRATFSGVRPGLGEAYGQSDAEGSFAAEEAAAMALTVPGWLADELRQPVICGAFLRLYEEQRTAVDSLLADEVEARDLLADSVVVWFLTKCERRRQWVHPGNLREALARAAAGTPDTDRRYSADDWRQLAAGDGCLDREDCRALYMEALSGGLIAEQSDRAWRWNHPFVHAFLCRLAQRENWRPAR